jgi:hypothetical protein
MTTRKKSGTHKRRKPSHRKTGEVPAKARRPQPDTLTLDRLQEFLREEILRSKGEELYPCQQEYLRRRRPYVEDGDLLALFSALQRCRQPVRRGFSYEDARLNPQLDPNEPVSEIPRWLLDAALKLLWRGLFNEWPTGEARHARTARKAYDMRKDLLTPA